MWCPVQAAPGAPCVCRACLCPLCPGPQSPPATPVPRRLESKAPPGLLGPSATPGGAAREPVGCLLSGRALCPGLSIRGAGSPEAVGPAQLQAQTGGAAAHLLTADHWGARAEPEHTSTLKAAACATAAKASWPSPRPVGWERCSAIVPGGQGENAGVNLATVGQDTSAGSL